jgi:hypothetical protein
VDLNKQTQSQTTVTLANGQTLTYKDWYLTRAVGITRDGFITGTGVRYLYNELADRIETRRRSFVLLPIEIAPEVLAVNSDFDEGRVDSTTGYPIPDCDDMPGVDPETGAGNTMLRIDTEREHLDERFANDERVTEDMHKGWFADS